jgi:hypothetical protein
LIATGWDQAPIAIPTQFKHVVMEVLEGRTMANTNKGEIAIYEQLIKLLLCLHIKGTSRLI